ncbi:UNVERIFIED_ORG: hypothetical protein QE446_002156 [Rhizobium sp. SORGH_AS260]|nr:hypothetical protein [Rhizobium sp. SORGH_AS_0260]
MKTISAEEFDRMADDGEDIGEYLDWTTARHLNIEPKRVNIDFPTWVVNDLDNEGSETWGDPAVACQIVDRGKA